MNNPSNYAAVEVFMDVSYKCSDISLQKRSALHCTECALVVSNCKTINHNARTENLNQFFRSDHPSIFQTACPLYVYMEITA